MKLNLPTIKFRQYLNILVSKYFLTAVFIIVAASSAFFWFNRDTEKASAGWWDENWAFRQAIRVTKTTADQSNVYIVLTLNTLTASTKMQTDCGDFRFVDERGAVLKYYVSSGCRTASNVIHVFYPSLTIGDHDLFFYYGNNSAPNGFEPAAFTTVATNYSVSNAMAVEVVSAPVAYWRFDEGVGTVVLDQGPGLNHGTITGASWQNESECVSGSCMYFDGNDYISISDSNFLSPGYGNWTISLWAKAENVASTSYMIGKTQSGSPYEGYSLNICGDYDCDTNGKKLAAIFIQDGVNAQQTESVNDVVDSGWHHYVMVADAVSDEIRLYVDGKEDTGTQYQPGGWPTIDNTDALTIGRAYGSYYYRGFLDEVKMYATARTATEVAQDYAAGLAGLSANSGASAAFGRSDQWLTDGLFAYYKFDEPAGSWDDDEGYEDALDSSGNGNNGDAEAHADVLGGALYGGGAELDGTDDTVNIADNGFDGMGQLTISAWILQYTAQGEWSKIVSKGNSDGSDGSYYFQFDDTGYINFGVHTTGVSSYATANSVWSTTYQWRHVVGTYDGATVRLYIDSVLQDDIAPASGAVRDTTYDTSIGANGYTEQNFFNGLFEEVRFYDRALSAAEVARLYKWAPGPIAHWKFDEMTGTSTLDSSGNGSTGRLGLLTTTSTSSPVYRPGKFGGALEFDGDNDELFIGQPAKLTSIPVKTITAWVKLDTMGEGQYARIMDKNESGLTGWNFMISTSPNFNSLEYQHQGPSSSNGDWVTSGNAIATGTWAHIAVMYDERDADNDPVFFVNGMIQDMTEISTPSAGVMDGDSGVNLRIGNRHDFARTIDGLIDDVRIYDYWLSNEQIIQAMNGRGPGNEMSGGAVGDYALYMPLDAGYGTTAYDEGPFRLKGMIYPGTAGSNTATSAMWTMDGKFGSAMEFDGTDDRISIDPQSKLWIEKYGGYTFSLWFKKSTDCNSTNGNEVMASRYGVHDMNNTWWFGCDGDTDRLTIHIFDSGAAPGPLFSTKIVDDGVWHHGLWTYSGDGDTVCLYFDGALEGCMDAVLAGDITASNPVCLGNYDEDCDSGYDYGGLLDDVRIYRFAMNKDQVKNIYAQGKGAMLGALGTGTTTADEIVPSNSAARAYCVPGDTTLCRAPVGEWKMDELSGTTAYDTSGNGNDGNLGGGTAGYRPTWSVYGKKGSALNFDGTNDYVTLGNTSAFDFGTTGNFTLSGWFKTTSLVNSPRLINNGYSANTNGFRYQFYNDNSITAGLGYNGTAGTGLNISLSGKVDGNWHYVSAVFDQSTKTITQYLDGIKAVGTLDAYATCGSVSGGVLSYSACSGVTANHSVNSVIGSYDGTGEFFNGLIDEVRIYDYARTPAQIAWDFNRGKPMAEWRFDECNGGTIHDESGNGKHGQLILGTTGVTATGTCASSSDSFWYNGRNGKRNSAGSFDGTDDYFESIFAYTPTTFSASWWIFPHTTGDDTQRIGASNGWGAFWTHAQSGGDMYVGTDVGTRFTPTDLPVGTMATNVWQHFIFTFNNGTARFYKNGKQVAGKTGMTNPTNWGGFVVSTRIDGLLDDVKVWNYALTPEQVKTEYTGGAVRFE